MTPIFQNDIYTLFKQKSAYVGLLVFLGIGGMTGYKFNISIGDELVVNAPYSVGFMTGLLSLTIILIATLLAFNMLFKETDANFGWIIFSTPIEKQRFALSRFFSFYVLTLIGFFCLTSGYAIGLNVQTNVDMNSGFHFWHFLYPFLVFGGVNTLLVCGILFWVAQKFKNKLLVAITGLLLYILYMVVLTFSNAPFMAQSLPQSMLAQRISSMADIFGLSAYFYEAKDRTIFERNHDVVPFTRFFLLNRLWVVIFSMGMVYLGVRSFSFLPVFKKKSRSQNLSIQSDYKEIPFATAETLFNIKTKWNSILSYLKIDLIYLFKSIPLIAVSLLLLFYVGMEMHGDIDMGIRLPQQYATSGRLAQTINGTFHFIGSLVMVYFVNDIFWRSQSTGFSIIQNITYFANEKLIGHIGSITLLIFYLTTLLLFEALAFQLLFDVSHFDWTAYVGVYIFNSLPLLLFSLFLIFVNLVIKSKSIALGVSMLSFLLLATPISKSILGNPLFRFLSGYNGTYSDFLGYGPYLPLFLERLIFGFSSIAILFLIYSLLKSKNNKPYKILTIFICGLVAFISGSIFLDGYISKDKDTLILKKVTYEKDYRKYQAIPQPTIKEVNTQIDLFPNNQAYHIKGSYLLKNMHKLAVDSLLLNVPEGFKIKSLIYQYKKEIIKLDKPISELFLKQAILPGDSVRLNFELEYQWQAVNDHDPFNAILSNGSFMRISRYFPWFGYDAENEISDSKVRHQFALGKGTTIISLDSPKEKTDDFIQLKMQISTPKKQIAVGTGTLKKQWQTKDRNYYQYEAAAIPFRFAVSSANYKTTQATHKGVSISVLYNPLHDYNVNHLIENTKLTLDYCTENFGPFPFQSITFAEVSSFTQGFAGTAYPAIIFMTEDLTFNANVEEENGQDVVNELAGHEVAHFWWGTNQIDHDYREGWVVLTESLAMYTEMMIYKKMYGKEKMMKRVAIHQQIYDAQKGFNEHIPLLKATKNHSYVAYSKGAVVMVELSELIGEKQLNLALKNFLQKHKYPSEKPVSTDLIKEILNVADEKNHKKIKSLFM